MKDACEASAVNTARPQRLVIMVLLMMVQLTLLIPSSIRLLARTGMYLKVNRDWSLPGKTRQNADTHVHACVDSVNCNPSHSSSV